MSQRPSSLQALLAQTQGARPVAFVLAGHNGSGKSTLWYTRLADSLQIPLVNADRMMLSILPDADPRTGRLPALTDAFAGYQLLLGQTGYDHAREDLVLARCRGEAVARPVVDVGFRIVEGETTG